LLEITLHYPLAFVKSHDLSGVSYFVTLWGYSPIRLQDKDYTLTMPKSSPTHAQPL